MEDLNEKQETVQNEELQTSAATEAQMPVGNDSNANLDAKAVEPEASENPVEATNEEEPEVDYSNYDREALLNALNELLNEEVGKVRNRVGSIRNQFNALNKKEEQAAFEKFLADGGNKEDYAPAADAVTEAFRKAYDVYRVRRQKYQEEIEQQKQNNLAAKHQILDQLRALIEKDQESLKATYDEFNVIQDKWKTIGDVPRDQMNDLWQNYHFLIEQFFNKVKINKELRMLDLKRNLDQKIQLCEKAEELIVETSVSKAFKSLQDLRAQWREIGPVPTEQNEEIWQRFNAAADKIDARRREFNDQRKEEHEQNLLAKQALIEKAAELTENTPKSVKEWNEVTNALDGLLKLWKSIGPVPREQNEEVWAKFKGMLDKHFADKKEHFGQMRDEQSENYNKKLDLCLKAEAIAKREDWKKATEELLKLQEEWKSIGSVNRKVSEKIWQRFRSACDEFFAKKGEFFKDIRSEENENLTKKLAIIEQIKAHVFGDNREENMAAIKNFQRQWAEVGHVPMKEKDRVQKEYHKLIDDIFEKLRLSAREAEETAYRERVNSNSADNGKFVSSERQGISDNLLKLRNDLMLWENNLGFLANSKQADLLKQEFEKKMQNARRQIALLEAKLRILNEHENQ